VPGIFDSSGAAEGQQKVFERSEFFCCPDESKILGVSLEAGVCFLWLLSLHKQRK
jgi:hypothetical protein